MATVVTAIFLHIGRRAPLPPWIRISGVAPFRSATNAGGWRVEVPKSAGKSDAVIYWSVWIQETNALAANTATVVAHFDANDLFNWPSSQTESGIVTFGGPQVDTNKFYRAVGTFESPGGRWVAKLYQSPLRPLLRLVPRRAQSATSEWVRIEFPSPALPRTK